MPSAWFEVTVEVPQEHADAVANFLMEHDAPGLQSDEQNGQSRITAYFSTEPPIGSLNRYCNDIGCRLFSPEGASIRVRTIVAQDWAENWKIHFQPQLVGSRLYVCPPWATTPPADRIPIVIDPGMAFGTGLHPTTRGCLQSIEWATEIRRITCAADFGTGSGILAIALAKLGVPEVWAVDTDPNACAIAATNAHCNQVERCLRIATHLDAAASRFDLLVANLFANLLEELAPQLTRVLQPDGFLICSGFLCADECRVANAFATLGLALQSRREEDSWVTLALRRQAPS